jgi:hypothetical protein
MTQLDQPGGFGGPRVVKPQVNVYTVLLVIACLFMGAALAWQVWNLLKLRDVSQEPTKATPAGWVMPSADRSGSTYHA